MIRWVEARMDMVDILQDIIIIRQETIGNKVGLNFHFYHWRGGGTSPLVQKGLGYRRYLGENVFFYSKIYYKSI